MNCYSLWIYVSFDVPRNTILYITGYDKKHVYFMFFHYFHRMYIDTLLPFFYDLFAPPPRTWSRLRNKKTRLYFKAGELGLHLGSEIHCGERIDGLRNATPKNLVE